MSSAASAYFEIHIHPPHARDVGTARIAVHMVKCMYIGHT